MSAIVALAGSVAAKQAFGKLVVGIYEYIKVETGRKLKQWRTEAQIGKLYQRLGEVRKVKTIWQVDRAVDIADFYCDSHVMIGAERRKIGHLEDLGNDRNVLIEGIAGQGKSIFLRYLCAVELLRGNCIPLLIELRRVSSKHPLRERIRMALRELALNPDDRLLDALVSSGKILLLLDAFDEVDDDLKPVVVNEIEDLVCANDKLRVVVTSRPHESMRASRHFVVVTLDNLNGDEYAHVIRRLAGGETWAEGLIDHIKRKARHVQELLCTPLMVTLLVLSYKSYQQLPVRLSEFYDSLFYTLLQRHDGSKPGFRRARMCHIDDTEYRHVFEALCLVSKSGGNAFDKSQVYAFARKALELCNVGEGPSKYIDDIVHITCLIVREGDEYRFIHRTVQEYYAASYIKRKPDPVARAFYEKTLARGGEGAWEQELEFLSEIDEYRYRKYYRLPALLRQLGCDEARLGVPWCALPLAKTKEMVAGLRVSFGPDGQVAWFLDGVAAGVQMEVLVQLVRATVAWLTPALVEMRETREGMKGVAFEALLEEPKVKTRLVEVLDKIVAGLFDEARRISNLVRDEGNPSLLDGLV